MVLPGGLAGVGVGLTAPAALGFFGPDPGFGPLLGGPGTLLLSEEDELAEERLARALTAGPGPLGAPRGVRLH